MIIDGAGLSSDSLFVADVAVIGAGPAGIVTALELARHGIDVILVETGGRALDSQAQQLSRAASRDEEWHAPVELAVRRQLGGTSAIWGGRCVPYDPIDFAPREIAPGSEWPLTYEEIAQHFGRASEWLRCGRPVFSSTQIPQLPQTLAPGLLDDEVVNITALERWSLPTDFGREYAQELRTEARVRVLLGLTATELLCSSETERIVEARCRSLGGTDVTVRATDFVITAGGLESTRLLMNSTAPRGGQLGNHSDHLGRWYMAHLEGVAAWVELNTEPRTTIVNYERDVDGTYVRRRFSFTEQFQLAQRLPNIVGWLTNPELADASHRNAQLSLTYLMLASRFGSLFAPEAQRLSLTGHRIPGTPYGRTTISPKFKHVINLLGHPISALDFITHFGIQRVFGRGRRPPGFFSYSPTNTYPFQYHGEHLPSRDSRVTLSDERDALGMRRLNIDLRFSDADIDGVVRAHRHWDDYLRRLGVGRLRYVDQDVAATVADRSGGGFHQVGTTRMARRAEDGVIDAQLKVFGVENAYVASSSSFVTSGQANSTFMIVAFAVRLADHLVARRR